MADEKVDDCLDQPVKVGDMVHLDPPTDHLRWRIQTIEPFLEPNMPPGMVKVTCVSKVTMGYYVPGTGHNPGLTRIYTAEQVEEKEVAQRQRSSIIKPS